MPAHKAQRPCVDVGCAAGELLSFECFETIEKSPLVDVDVDTSPSSGCSSTTGPLTPLGDWCSTPSEEEEEEDDRSYLKHLFAMEASNTLDGGYLERQAPGAGLGPCSSPMASRERASVVDWMTEAAGVVGLPSDVLFLGVALLDRFLAARVAAAAAAAGCGAKPAAPERPLQLVAAVALWVATKYEHGYGASVEVFRRDLLCGMYSRRDLLDTEAELLRAVDYRLSSIVTPHAFLTRAFRGLPAREAARAARAPAAAAAADALFYLTSYLSEAALLEYSMLPFAPSAVAASALALAHLLLGLPVTSEELRARSGYGWEDITLPFAWLRQVHVEVCRAGANRTPYAAWTKFLTAETRWAAAVPPLLSFADPRLPEVTAGRAAAPAGAAGAPPLQRRPSLKRQRAGAGATSRPGSNGKLRK